MRLFAGDHLAPRHYRRPSLMPDRSLKRRCDDHTQSFCPRHAAVHLLPVFVLQSEHGGIVRVPVKSYRCWRMISCRATKIARRHCARPCRRGSCRCRSKTEMFPRARTHRSAWKALIAVFVHLSNGEHHSRSRSAIFPNACTRLNATPRFPLEIARQRDCSGFVNRPL